MNSEIHLVIQGSFPKDYILLGAFTDLEDAHEFCRPRLSALAEIYKNHIPSDGIRYIPTIITKPVGEMQKTYPWVVVLIDGQGRVRDANIFFKLREMISTEIFARRVTTARSDAKPTFQGTAPSLAQAKLLAEEERREWLDYLGDAKKKVVPSNAVPASFWANANITPLVLPPNEFEDDGGPD